LDAGPCSPLLLVLASDAVSDMTGQTLLADGGREAGTG
jgi:hypothetical protein